MESENNLFETLTEEQQLQVYELMAIANIEDGNIAAKILIDANYDINRAVQRWFDRNTGGLNEQPRDPRAFVNDNIPPEFLPQANQPNNQESELHAQYRRFIQRKLRDEEERGITDMVKDGVSSVFSRVQSILRFFIPVFIRGETSGGEEFQGYYWRSHYNLYRQLRWNTGTFEQNLMIAHESRRPLLVFIQVNRQEYREIPENLFGNQALTDFMNNKFQLLGLLDTTEEGRKMTRFIEGEKWPCLGIFKHSLVEEPILLEAIPLTNESTPIQVLEQLRNIESNFFIILSEEDHIKRDVQRSIDAQRSRNMQINNPFFFANTQTDENYRLFNDETQPAQPNNRNQSLNQSRIEEDRLLRQIQQEEYKEVERKILEQQQQKEREERTRRETIEKEETARKQKEEEERAKQEARELKKKNKLSSLPAEPEESDPSAILIIFRLPDGNRIERRFRNSDKAQVLYDYVDTKDIQFDASTARYDLMQPRPFLCLDDNNKPIGEYFEGSNNEVITIRELTE